MRSSTASLRDVSAMSIHSIAAVPTISQVPGAR
jgi:hypothetical protein